MAEDILDPGKACAGCGSTVTVPQVAEIDGKTGLYCSLACAFESLPDLITSGVVIQYRSDPCPSGETPVEKVKIKKRPFGDMIACMLEGKDELDDVTLAGLLALINTELEAHDHALRVTLVSREVYEGAGNGTVGHGLSSR